MSIIHNSPKKLRFVPGHPAALGSFANWFRMLRSAGGIELRFLPRALFVLLTTLITEPLKMAERFLYGRAIERIRLDSSPVIIIGHWRSGTTHLHNLLSQDDRFGFVSTFQAMAPDFSILANRWLRPIIGRFARKFSPTRLIDNMPVDLDAPQEEEFALSNLSPYSFLHLYSFPRKARQIVESYVLFGSLPEVDQTSWAKCQQTVMRKAAYISGKKRLLLKNPAHSARIRTLLELFPNAKFVFIHRDPYRVFLSTRNMYKKLLQCSQLQHISANQIEKNILRIYEMVMKKYLADRYLIPQGNLVEISYEDLEKQPQAQLEKIYQSVDLEGYKAAEMAFQGYLESVAAYQKNDLALDVHAILQVNRHWRFAFEAWDYALQGI